MKPLVVLGAPLSGHKLVCRILVSALQASGYSGVEGDEIRPGKTLADFSVNSYTFTEMSDIRAELISPSICTPILCRRNILDLGAAYSSGAVLNLTRRSLGEINTAQKELEKTVPYTVPYEGLLSTPEQMTDWLCNKVGLTLLDFLWVYEDAAAAWPLLKSLAMRPDLFSVSDDETKSKVEALLK
jgi:hypothetical protein